MGKRAVAGVFFALLLGGVLAAPVQAKCCALDHLIVSVPGQDDVRISVTELDDQLHAAEQGNLYWPALNSPFKGDERPAGKLGLAYEITYVLDGVEGDPIYVHEIVYLEADPPVAYAPKGQTQELYPGDVRPVPWGWRPFPERAANAVQHILDEARQGSVTGDFVITYDRSWLARFGPTIAVLAILAGLALFWFRPRRMQRLHD